MKIKTLAIYIYIFLGLFSTFSSCNGQNKSENLRLSEKMIAPDKTVLQIGEGISVIYQDQNNNFWFAGNGVYNYTPPSSDEQNKNLVYFSKQDGLCSNKILSIQEDKKGNIYFDTPEGVSKYDGEQFTTLEISTNSITNNNWKLEPDDLWFRMGWEMSGPFRYDGKSLHYLEFPKSYQEEVFIEEYPKASFNPYGIYSIYQDKEGSIWFGTAAMGLCRYDGRSVDWLYEKQLTETPAGGAFGIRSIIEDKDGHFWFCNTMHRFEILPTGSTNLLKYRKRNGIGKSKINEETYFPFFMSVAEDDNGDLWMATFDEGVYRNNGKELMHYPVKDGNNNVTLFSIYKDRQGGLWLGTQNAGIFKLNGNKFEKFSL